MKKSVLKAIRDRADALPVITTTTKEVHYVLGEELLQQGHTLYGDAPIEPKLTYPYEMPVIISYNHYRRMKKAYEGQGLAGIKAYEDSIADIVENRQKESL